MISQRYHVYSLIAVFLALTIGVLLGISIGGGTAGQTDAISRQSQAIQRLNVQFKDFSARLAAKQQTLDHTVQDLREADALIDRFVPDLVASKLSGRGVAIVQLGAHDDTYTRVRAALEASGARISSVTRINPEFGFSQPETMAKAAASVPLEFQDPGKEAHQQVWGYLATVLAAGRDGKPLEPLASVDMLKPSGDYSLANGFVVIVGPAELEPPNGMDLIVRPLLTKIASAGIKACVATTLKPESQTENSPWSQLDVPSVTHAEWAVGQLSIVDILSRGKGRYGFAPGDRFYPDDITGQ